MSPPPEHGINTTLGSLDLDPATIVSESDSLENAAKAILLSGTSCAVLDQLPLRIVTERDFVGALAQGRPAGDRVALIASESPYWTVVDATVAEAASLMMNLNVRHLVVLNGAGRPAGTVSISQLFSIVVPSQEPIALYESFAAFMTQGSAG